MKIELKILAIIILITGIMISTSIKAIEIQEGKIERIKAPEIRTFNSIEELKEYVRLARMTQYYYPMIGIREMPFLIPVEEAKKYSTTNIQVEGVDEADIVKTDGEYIYIATRNKVYIISAYPPENAEIKKELSFNGTVKGLFISENRLIIIASTMNHIKITIKKNETSVTEAAVIIPEKPYYTLNTTIFIYDIADIQEPILINLINATGFYMTSRMIDKYVYVILRQPIIDQILILPEINGEKIKPNQIKYIVGESGQQFTNIIAVNIESGEFRSEVYLLGASSYIYMSPRNLYMIVPRWFKPEDLLDEIVKAITPIIPKEIWEKIIEIMNSNLSKWEKGIEIMQVMSNWFNSLSSEERIEYAKKLIQAIGKITYSKWFESTAIYKFKLDKLEVKLTAKNIVPGRVLDQFSMDEYKNQFRISTTKTKYEVDGERIRPVTSNSIYILNEKLEIIGKIEDIAVEERIYAARYLGDTMFLVTFRRVDPLFGIDLSNPQKPEVVGYLKIPGYAEYLHPYKEKYLIGIGMHTDEEGRIKGMKISLFNISSLKDIKEVSKIIMEGKFWSPIFRDHKAFMINLEKQYFTIPIEGEKEGVIVIEIEDGELEIKGIIEHENAQRTIYIEQYIYTISPNLMKILTEELTPIRTIQLNR